MRLPFVALVLASATFASAAFADDASKKPAAESAEKDSASTGKKTKDHHKKKITAHVAKKALGSLPHIDGAPAKVQNAAEKKKSAAKTAETLATHANDDKAGKPDAAKDKDKASDKAEKAGDKAEKANEKVAAKGDKKDSDDPPEELTGSLPQAKLAAKKKSDKKKDDGFEKKSDDKSDKTDDKSDSKKKHGGKALKVSAGTGATEFDKLQKKPIAEKGKKLKACLNPAVTFARLGQATDITFALTTCKGSAAPGAVENLSILARPYDVPAPALEPMSILAKKGPSAKPNKALAMPNAAAEIAPGIKRVDPGLVTRIQAIADKFPGKTITLVSGYRPQSKGSPHQAARAMDIRIDGVTNEALVAYCKTLPDTGCGYYPNSYFVHVDVRPLNAGHVYWIDISGPGEKPTYVKQWPLPLPAKIGTVDPKSLPALPSETMVPETDEAKIGTHEDDDESSTPSTGTN